MNSQQIVPTGSVSVYINGVKVGAFTHAELWEHDHSVAPARGTVETSGTLREREFVPIAGAGISLPSPVKRTAIALGYFTNGRLYSIRGVLDRFGSFLGDEPTTDE